MEEKDKFATPEEILEEKRRYEKSQKEDFGELRSDQQLPGQQDPTGAREQREKQQRIRTDIEQARADFERDRIVLENIKAEVWQKGIDALMREKNQSEPVPLVDVLDWKSDKTELENILHGLVAEKILLNNDDEVQQVIDGTVKADFRSITALTFFLDYLLSLGRLDISQKNSDKWDHLRYVSSFLVNGKPLTSNQIRDTKGSTRYKNDNFKTYNPDCISISNVITDAT